MAKPVRQIVALSSTLVLLAITFMVPFVQYAQTPQTQTFGIMQSIQGHINQMQSEIGLVRAEHSRLMVAVMANAEQNKQQTNTIENLRKTLDGLTIGPLASPLSHDLDKRVARIQEYVDSDRSLKAEAAWWIRTMGGAAILWAGRQIWTMFATQKKKRREKRATRPKTE